MSRKSLRELADRSIGPVDGFYLRPWSCSGEPASARVFLIGANPATSFPSNLVERERYLDALVGGGDALSSVYAAARGDGVSPTRRNMEMLIGLLAEQGVQPVLETNVWTVPTSSLAKLDRVDPTLASASTRVVLELVTILRPSVLIVHGARATRGLASLLRRQLAAAELVDPVSYYPGEPLIIALPSLSPPRANAWLPTASYGLREMAIRVAAAV